MSPLVVTLLAFLGGFVVVVGFYSLTVDFFLRDRTRVHKRLDDEFQQARSETMARKAPVFKDLSKLRAEAMVGQEPKASLWESLLDMIQQAGLAISPQRLLQVGLVVGSVLGLGVGFLAPSWPLGAALAVVGVIAPFGYVYFRRKRRLEKILSQLPDAFDLIARILRAGQTPSQAFQAVADECDSPIADEFGYCFEQQNLGLAPDVALREMARRIDLVEIKIFVLAVLVQRQTGGNLAELIDNLAAIVRERYRIRGKIKALTAEGRMEATVLIAMPPVVFALLMVLNRDYAWILLEHPNVLWGMLGFMLVGSVWIRRIVNYDF